MKRFSIVSQLTSGEYIIRDGTNGKRHHVDAEVYELLNALSCKCDTITVELIKLIDVMNKYGIKDAEKLDQVLFNQRVW